MSDNLPLFASSYVPDREIKPEDDDDEYPSSSIPRSIADEEAWLNFEDDQESRRAAAASDSEAEDAAGASGSTKLEAEIEEEREDEDSSCGKKSTAPTPLVKCLFCGTQVPGDRAYMDHINRFHAAKPRRVEHKLRCEVCMKPAATKKELEVHMRSHAYTNRTLQQCTVCDKKVRTPTELRQHMRSHTGEKPFVCEFCGKNYSSNSEANKHRRQAHKVKPHGCSACGQRFDLVQQLRDHKKCCSK